MRPVGPADAGAWWRVIAGLALAVFWLAGSAAAANAARFAAVVFDDVPSRSPEELLPAYQARLGEPLDEALAAGVVDAFVRQYRDAGLLAPAPRVVRRHVAAGVLVMEMREAHVARVQLTGDEQVNAAELAPLLDELRAMRPLSLGGFDRWLQRANGLGIPLRGSLIRASAGSPAYLARLSVMPRRWQGVVHLDNRGPAQLGQEIAQLSLLYRSPRETLGHLRLDAAVALDHSRLRYAGISGRHRVRERGERLSWRYARSESTLPIPTTSRTVDYEREQAEVRWHVPLVNRLRQRSAASLALRSYDLDQFLDDGRHLRRDRIRALEARYEWRVATASGGRHIVEAALHRGLEGLGASLSPPGAARDFTVLTGRHRYSRPLPRDWLLRTDLHLQASDDRLPASERFFIGGRSFGGAFDPATLSGDRGLGIRLGMERPLPFVAADTSAYAYYDHGWVRSVDRARPGDDAGSVGIGARGSIGKLAWSVELGVPAHKPRSPTLLGDDPRLFFSLAQRF